MAERRGPAEALGPPADAPGRPRGRTRLAGLVLAAVLGASGCQGGAVLEASATASTATAPTSTARAAAATTAEREDALRQLLDERASAVLAGDVEGVLATTDPAATAFRERQADTARGLARVPLGSWSYEVQGEGPGLGDGRRAELGPDAWVADVVLSYRVAGVDPVDQRRQQSLTVVRRDGRWLLAGDADGPGRPDVWDLGPVDVVEGRRTLVVGTAERAVLEQQAALGDAAAERVDAVWGTGWPRRTVVLVPADQSQLARLLGRDDETGLAQVAALTTGVDRSSGAPGAAGAVDRVLVNPAGLEVLGDLGRAVVLTHETTHVAVRAGAAADPPLWLSEGFADLVAYSGEADLPPRVVAQDLLADVRAGRGPSGLPDETAFDAAREDIAPAYSSAWLAARTVEQRYGRPALLELVRTTSGRTPVEGGSDRGAEPGAAPVPLAQAVPQVLGVDLAVLEQQWLEDLAVLAGEAG
ncbi:hypothetical protein [uncultured Pseudokineococcus sp.]|uniref:hypothetical protein n=1 Tax=uncultured Pseudokineococcus sp. TaxID=1642928 RepID=UPI0026249FDA|nr:hypothetical protein [uncultured Pseudokineococcus sp.]